MSERNIVFYTSVVINMYTLFEYIQNVTALDERNISKVYKLLLSDNVTKELESFGDGRTVSFDTQHVDIVNRVVRKYIAEDIFCISKKDDIIVEHYNLYEPEYNIHEYFPEKTIDTRYLKVRIIFNTKNSLNKYKLTNPTVYDILDRNKTT